MNKTLKNTLKGLVDKQATELADTLFGAAKDGDEEAVDLIMDAAAGAGMCTIMELQVILTSKGIAVKTGGSKPIKNFFEDRVPEANETVLEYADKAMDLGAELIGKLEPLMIECGMIITDPDKEK